MDWGSRTMSFGKTTIEDVVGMSLIHPLDDEYWKEREIKFENITCPVFLTCSYTQWNHSRGPFDGFNRLGTEQKWMREQMIKAIMEKPSCHGELSYNRRSEAGRNMNEIGG